MGKVLAPVGAMFGIGQKDDPTFQPGQANTAAYTKFSQEAHPETEGIAGTQMATDAVRSNALSSGLFGAGGLQDRLGTEEQDLASRGYGLQQQDHEAYGQAAGDIARQFGQQESDTANALNRRGLGGASSGAAGAAFSGLQGSKNEMLAKAQTGIAQKRMADTTQRLQATRNMMGQLGAQGQGAIQSQFDRQVAGRNQRGNELQTAMQGEQNINNQNRQANEDAIGHKSKNIGDAWAEGKYSGTKSGEADATSSWMKMGSSGGGMMSDENNKTNITDGSSKVQKFMGGIANSHDYSGGLGGSGTPAPAGGQQQKTGAAARAEYNMPWSKFLKPPGEVDKDEAAAGGGGGGEGQAQLVSDPDGRGAGAGVTPMSGGLGGMGGGSGGGDGGMMDMLGGLGSMLSDENDKTSIRSGNSDIEGFMDSVKPHSYEYKEQYKDNPLAGRGEFVSPMAQELEKTDLGKSMVRNGPEGKEVDYGKGFGTMLSAIADLHTRVKKQEGRK